MIHQLYFKKKTKTKTQGLPGQYRGKNQPGQRRGHRFNPQPGKTPHARGQLHPQVTTAEAQAPRVCGPHQEKLQLTATRENTHRTTKTLRSQKKKKSTNIVLSAGKSQLQMQALNISCTEQRTALKVKLISSFSTRWSPQDYPHPQVYNFAML